LDLASHDAAGVLDLVYPAASAAWDEIIAAVWPGTVVEDNNLTVQMSTLRRILDRGRAEGSCFKP
jgi:hypothetical protein